ncbi:MAG: ribosome biogenesis GTP-binding protein YihA/YsxC [Caldimicrobium sp.]
MSNKGFKKVEFIKSVYKLSELPPPKYREIAILGRSNAGKSSLINALLNQKGIARVSSTPGFTKALNFFLIDNKIYLVDLPGYGFAKVPKEMYSLWKELIEGYFQSKRDFALLILIFDIRRTPDHLDLSLVEFVKKLRIPYLIVLNKKDTLKEIKIKEQIKVYQEKFLLSQDAPLFVISCKTKEGLQELHSFIEKIAY